MSDTIKGRTVWITRSLTSNIWLIIWTKKPRWISCPNSSARWGGVADRHILTSACATLAGQYIGPIPAHVKEGGSKAIAKGTLYVAADWEE